MFKTTHEHSTKVLCRVPEGQRSRCAQRRKNTWSGELCPDRSPGAVGRESIIDTANGRKNGKLDFIKMKSFCSANDKVNRIRRKTIDWENNICKSHKELSFQIHKEVLKLNHQNRNNLVKKWAKELYRHLNKKGIQVTNKHTKR